MTPNGQTWLQRYLAETTLLTTLAETSPAHGEAGVAVTRETIFRFNQPLTPTTIGTCSR